MEKVEKIKKQCHCPYCDIPVSVAAAFCGGCGTKLRFCGECGCAVPRIAERCHRCGTKLEAINEQRSIKQG